MKRFVCCLVVFLAVATQANAALLTYTESAIASGSLNGVNFTNVLVTVSTTADSANITRSGSLLLLRGSTGFFSVAGLGSGSFLAPLQVFSNQQSSLVGISGYTPNVNTPGSYADIIDTQNQALANYDLTTPVGPTTGVITINPGFSFATSAGNLQLNSAPATSTFAATVPEPSSFVLCGLAGVGGLIGCLPRRRTLSLLRVGDANHSRHSLNPGVGQAEIAPGCRPPRR